MASQEVELQPTRHSVDPADALRIAGVTLIVVGLCCNEWLLTWLFSKDGVLDPSTKVVIRSFNALAIGAGLTGIRFAASLPTRLRRLGQWVRRHLAIGLAISLLTMIALVTTAEFVFHFLNQSRFAYHEEIIGPQPFNIEDPLLGYKPRPSSQVRSIQTFQGRPAYDVVYSIDAFSRRMTPGQDGKHAARNLLFFGDSFTFGEGVNDDETMPFYVGQMSPSSQVYNYGYKGYGTHQVLAKLQGGALPDEVPPARETMLIYVFIDEHVQRSIGALHSFKWASNTPYYVLEGDRLVRKGSFRTGRNPLVNVTYDLLAKSEILRFFKVGLPLRASQQDVRLTCRMIEETRREFLRQFPGGQFYVLFYPGAMWTRMMRNFLEPAGVACLDYERFVDFFHEPKYQIPLDRHPNPRMHHLMAERLVTDLELGEGAAAYAAAVGLTEGQRATGR